MFSMQETSERKTICEHNKTLQESLGLAACAKRFSKLERTLLPHSAFHHHLLQERRNWREPGRYRPDERMVGRRIGTSGGGLPLSHRLCLEI